MFWKKESEKKEVVPKATTKHQYSKIVREIHNEFDTAAEKILAETAEILKNNKTEKQNLNMKKIEMLEKAGFYSNSSVKSLRSIEREEKTATARAEMIHKYQVKYPNYKFVTTQQVKEICEKYKLILGDISLFTGFVPQKNLDEILAFTGVKQEDVLYEIREWGMRGPLSFRYVTKAEGDRHLGLGHTAEISEIPVGLSICAPEKDFNTDNMRVENHELVPDDPIVLQRVPKGFLVITAWGDEASDPIIVNQNNN